MFALFLNERNKKMGKKKVKLSAIIITASIGLVLSSALIVGTVVANNYASVLDNTFARSNYRASEAEKECAEDVVREGTVLLVNKDNALPLKDNEKKVAVFGQNSVDFVYGGSGSGSVDTSSAPTLKDALEDPDHGGLTVDKTLWDFYTKGAGSSYRKSFPNVSGQGQFIVNEVPLSVLSSGNGVSNIAEDDVAIVTIGRSGGESSDLPFEPLPTGSLYLQVDPNEKDTIKYACDNFNKVILIVNANNPVELGFLNEANYSNVKSVLWVGGVGQEGMYGLADIISGKTNPSGRLVDTFAYDSLSAPAMNNFGNYTIANADANTARANKHLVYGEGIYVGYRYYETRYEDKVLGRSGVGDFDYDQEVQFPFGFGLSYTTFEYNDFTVNENSDGKSYDVSVTVKNSGEVAGKHTVEVFASKPYTGLVEVSAVDLVGYAKTKVLAPNETENLRINISKKEFASYDANINKTYVLDAGDYYLGIGESAHDALNNILTKKEVISSGNSALAIKAFTIDSLDATSLSKSVFTDYAIANQFDDADVRKYDSSFTYLSRSNWEATLLSSKDYQNKNWTAPAELIEDLRWNRSDEVINDPSLPTVKFSQTVTNHKVQDLVNTPLSDPKWQELVEQLSWNEISRLVRIGGYSTMAIDAIGLPQTIDKDGPSGISGTLTGGQSCMAWPAEVVLASTWNDELIERVGVHIGEDSIASGTAGWYAPGVDIHRTPYSGRNFEYYSEDGFLSGKIGAAEMRGVRSMGVIAYAKHFALNDQETNRYGGVFFANEQEIREICLKGFEYTIAEGKATAVMVAMNRVGTTWAGAHRGLMTNVLRNEWGFEGLAITDQASVTSMYYQDMISGLYAGTDLWLNSNAQLWPLSAVDETIGGLSGKSVSYKNNNTVNYYLQRAAKNVIYGVTMSNAVQSYSNDVSNSSYIIPWRLLIGLLDGVIIGGAIVATGLLTLFYFKGKRDEKQ